MDGLLILTVMASICLLTYLISYIFVGISLILFGIILMGLFLIQNNFYLLFIVLLMSSLLILRIIKLDVKNNSIDF